MNIYFAGTIRGNKSTINLHNILNHLKQHGNVLSEIAFVENNWEVRNLTDEEIFKQDCSWIDQSNIVIAEVSSPSLGVGYELAYAEKKNKKVICLCQKDTHLSGMVSGNTYFEIHKYSDEKECLDIINKLFN